VLLDATPDALHRSGIIHKFASERNGKLRELIFVLAPSRNGDAHPDAAWLEYARQNDLKKNRRAIEGMFGFFGDHPTSLGNHREHGKPFGSGCKTVRICASMKSIFSSHASPDFPIFPIHDDIVAEEASLLRYFAEMRRSSGPEKESPIWPSMAEKWRQNLPPPEDMSDMPELDLNEA